MAALVYSYLGRMFRSMFADLDTPLEAYTETRGGVDGCPSPCSGIGYRGWLRNPLLGCGCACVGGLAGNIHRGVVRYAYGASTHSPHSGFSLRCVLVKRK